MAPVRLRMSRTMLLPVVLLALCVLPVALVSPWALLVLEHHQLTPADAPALQLVVYTPVDGTGSAAKLIRLVG